MATLEPLPFSSDLLYVLTVKLVFQDFDSWPVDKQSHVKPMKNIFNQKFMKTVKILVESINSLISRNLTFFEVSNSICLLNFVFESKMSAKVTSLAFFRQITTETNIKAAFSQNFSSFTLLKIWLKTVTVFRALKSFDIRMKIDCKIM